MSINRKRPIEPWIAKQMVADEKALSGIGKIIFCHADNERSMFGGVVSPHITAKDDNWRMSIGTLLWLPCQQYILKIKSTNQTLQDLLLGSLGPAEWKEENNW